MKRAVWLAIFLCGAIAGCGYKGDLSLPSAAASAPPVAPLVAPAPHK